MPAAEDGKVEENDEQDADEEEEVGIGAAEVGINCFDWWLYWRHVVVVRFEEAELIEDDGELRDVEDLAGAWRGAGLWKSTLEVGSAEWKDCEQDDDKEHEEERDCDDEEEDDGDDVDVGDSNVGGIVEELVDVSTEEVSDEGGGDGEEIEDDDEVDDEEGDVEDGGSTADEEDGEDVCEGIVDGGKDVASVFAEDDAETESMVAVFEDIDDAAVSCSEVVFLFVEMFVLVFWFVANPATAAWINRGRAAV